MAMSLQSAPLLAFFRSQLRLSTSSARWRTTSLFSGHASSLTIAALASVLPAVQKLSLPSSFSEIWESILRAVPKKKTSHMKKRHRQMAGKALKDVTSLNKCSACGSIKRAHFLCPYCVADIKRMWLEKDKPKEAKEEAKSS